MAGAALRRMLEDPDIRAEAGVKLNWRPNQGGHRPNQHTRRLIQQAGGLEGIKRFTELFYAKAFADPHLDTFIRDRSDPHGDRFARWICEKFGDGTPWTEDRASRPQCPFSAHGHKFQSAHDRSSAHFAAWHSPKRQPGEWGEHFKLDDCRVWMRLHFWALREAGLYDQAPEFCDYYVR